MSQANATTKHKAIAIPVIRTQGQESQFLVVRDRRFKDWIFVTGGCRRREIPNPLRTALRELEEETRGVISLKRGEYAHYDFTVPEAPGSDVELIYNVYIFFVDWDMNERDEMVRRFYEEKAKCLAAKLQKKPIKRTFDENDHMVFETMGVFAERKQWDLILDNVIKNPKFYECLETSDRKTFAFK